MKKYEKPQMIIDSLLAEKDVANNLDVGLDGPEVELSAGDMLGL